MKRFRDSIHYLYDNPSVSYTHCVAATWKHESELSGTKELKSKAVEVEAREGISVLATLHECVSYVMATLDTKNSSSGNQRNK